MTLLSLVRLFVASGALAQLLPFHDTSACTLHAEDVVLTFALNETTRPSSAEPLMLGILSWDHCCCCPLLEDVVKLLVPVAHPLLGFDHAPVLDV